MNKAIIIGMKFFVMREIEGDTLFDPALASYAGADRHALFYAKIDVLAAWQSLTRLRLGLRALANHQAILIASLAHGRVNIAPVKPK